MNKAEIYLMRKASRWVSVVVLLGCVAITFVLVYGALKAQAIGNKLINDPYQMEDL